MQAGPENAATAWLQFISTLIWQAIVIFVLFYFRSPLAALLKRLAKVKFGDKEVFFHQTPDEGATDPGGEAARELLRLGAEGPFTEAGIRDLIAKSDQISSDEKVVQTLLLFETRTQHTWLIATNKQLFCVLDDEKTRYNNRMIQWRMPLDHAAPVVAVAHRQRSGKVNIGDKRNWLYSRKLFPTPGMLEERIAKMVAEAKAHA